MARILSVSYDETLLRTRELMLRGAAHAVVSAVGYHDGQDACLRSQFELCIIGHSIPKKDKLAIIECFRAHNPQALVIALTRAGEVRLPEVDTYINPGNPEELLRAIERALHPQSDRRLRRIK